ncbi:hypothetical protein PUN28_013918 [Cardiocondyla obscurior]|uniref:Uncharacterized protein n=1 Tax=Cardiocondyla obscurior TaxID=286306 RepID=A0AAW2F3S0_9HYME
MPLLFCSISLLVLHFYNKRYFDNDAKTNDYTCILCFRGYDLQTLLINIYYCLKCNVKFCNAIRKEYISLTNLMCSSRIIQPRRYSNTN